MYKEIKDKIYKSKPLYAIDKLLDITLLILSISNILIYCFISKKIYVYLPIILIETAIFIIVFSFYYKKIIKIYIPNKKTNKSLKEKFIIARDLYNANQTKKFKEELIKILKEYNINTKDKLELLIQYYRRYLPEVAVKKTKKIFITSFTSTLTILTAIYYYNTSEISVVFLISIISSISITILAKIITFIQRIIGQSENEYIEIEEVLMTLYFSFETYEKELNQTRKTNRKQKKTT